MTAIVRRDRSYSRTWIVLEVFRGRDLVLSAQWRPESFTQAQLMRVLGIAAGGGK